MKRKQLFCLLMIIISISVSAQSNAEKEMLIGTWTVEQVEYGEHYSYNVKEDELEPGLNLSLKILEDIKRFDEAFLEQLKKAAAKYANQSSFTINANGTYKLSKGGKTTQGKYSFLPKKKAGNTESDMIYNLAHSDNVAVIKLENGDSFGVRKDEDSSRLSFSVSDGPCRLNFIK